MPLDPLLFFQRYFQQEGTPHPQISQLENSAPGDFSIDLLVANRRKILEVKLAVLLSATKKRFAIRECSLESLLVDELTIRNQQLAGPRYTSTTGPSYSTEDSPQAQGLLEIEKQRREEETNCWRDIIPVMRDVLTTWEALEQARARAIFLAAYPATDPGTTRGDENQ